MKLVDKLIHKAGGGVKWALIAFVHDHDDHWSASFNFWDGAPGRVSPHSGYVEHVTQAEAVAAVEQAIEAFPHPLAWSQVIIDDYGPPGGSEAPCHDAG